MFSLNFPLNEPGAALRQIADFTCLFNCTEFGTALGAVAVERICLQFEPFIFPLSIWDVETFKNATVNRS